LDGQIDDWQEGPGLVDSMRRYWWLVASITLLAAVAAFVWSSSQPALYQGVVRLYLDTSGDQTDPGRIVRSQAEFITSPEVLDRTITLDGNRMSRKELEQRLTVEPARDADVITITVLDATRAQAGALAESVARAYRESVARQSAAAAKQEVAALNQRQEQLAGAVSTPLDALVRITDDEWRRLLAVHLDGTFHGTRAAARAMAPRGAGAIVNMASVCGIEGCTGHPHYSAAKAGILGFTRSVAKELIVQGIRANAIAPGHVDTRKLRGELDASRRLIAAATPAGRLAAPEEIAATVAFLVSDDAAYFVGATLSPNGGLVTAV